jgi:hypothetical protein
VTQAWRRSDGARAFVRALEELGYVLATGKRPYVLVDLYGEMNALPKLIDDKQVRTKDIRAFLEREFPPESLQSVEEAKALVASHRKAIEDFGKAQARADRVDALKASQAERRRPLEDEQAALKTRQATERNDLALHQRAARQALEQAYEAEMGRVRLQRDKGRATGLVAVLARVSGFDAVRRQLRRHQDRRRHDNFVDELQALDEPQAQARLELQRRHEAQSLDLDRRRRALEQVEARELKSLETELRKERRVAERARGGGNRMPSLTLELKPPGRRDAAWRAKSRHSSHAALEETEHARRNCLSSPRRYGKNSRAWPAATAGMGAAQTRLDRRMEVSRRLPPSHEILPANGATVTGIAMTGSDRATAIFLLGGADGERGTGRDLYFLCLKSDYPGPLRTRYN